MLFAVLGVQLGYLSADDVLASARELAQPGESRSLSEFLVSRGILDRARAQVLERLTTRASTSAGGNASQTLELLPSAVRKLAAETNAGPSPVAPVSAPRAAVVDEQAHRYFSAPRADAPPRELGRGTFGRVLSMHDTVLGRDVAWKQAYEATPESDAALMAQARLLARLDHPSVVPIYELGRDAKGAVYATLRQVSADTLAEALTRANGLEERLALLPAVQTIVRCVAMAHEAGVTHRRLSCRSISLGRFGEVYLLGWGPPEDEAERPEAVAGDLKALGAILHEVVTGLPAPVMGAVKARGAPEDLLGLCRAALGGRLTTAEQLAHELKAFIDGRRLGSYRYSTWQLVKRYVRQHTLFSVMALSAFLLVMVGAATASAAVREERDRARLFARRFLDDVALRLRAQPGVEPLLEQVTTAALRHYQRTTDLQSAPREERLRVSRAMARLGVVSLSLSRFDEARQSLDFADVLAEGLADASSTDAQARVVLAQTAAARVNLPGLSKEASLRWAALARSFADQALVLEPDSVEVRRAAASARLQSALREVDASRALRDFDEAVKLLELAARDPAEELARRQALGAALVERARHKPKNATEARQLVERLSGLRERAPDDVELQFDAARAGLILAESLEVDALERSQQAAMDAGTLAHEVVSRRPDRADAAALFVRATLRSGRAQEALAAARGFEARGLEGMGSLIAEAALFAGEFELARTQAVEPGSAEGVLIRALAGAWLERPSDAVIQARVLKGNFDEVSWPSARLVRGLEKVAAGQGRGEVAVRTFAERWREVGGEASLGEFVELLENLLGN
ncbi:MAG: protein kinase [Archangium sp.]|nr:protein kinase [Archangium sp.]MDP3157162.1 protein kinase [Archangium sp.]MDP3575879.1 protein kinase [Archangium sp.]